MSALARYESAALHVTICNEISSDLPRVMEIVSPAAGFAESGRQCHGCMRTIERSQRILRIRANCRLSKRGPECLVRVQDAGIGFNADEAERLFEGFYTTKPNGMGMGLAVSRSIIEAHDGRLWAEVNEGCGATFTFSIPAAENGRS